MTLNHQSNILAWLATVVVVAVLTLTIFSSIDVRDQTDQIEMAENTVKGVVYFRFLAMETAFYRESRSEEQWRRHLASFRGMLATHHYSESSENALLAKEKTNLEVLNRLYENLIKADLVPITIPHTDTASLELTASTVSALFLTTQDMLDDAFELVRLDRIDLEAAQNHAALLMLFCIAALAVLIAAGCVIIKRRVLIPIAALQKGTEQVTKGDLTFRLNLTVANEIGFLASAFDNMTGQLEQSLDGMKAENTERRLAQVALQETVQQLADKSFELIRSQEELQIITDHIPALIVYWDKQLINRFANKPYQKWFGITPQQMLGKHISEIIGEERFQMIKPQLLSALQGNTETFERTIPYMSGETRNALFSYVPDIEDGKVKGLYGFISDVTPLKQAQAAQVAALAQLQNTVDAASEFSIITTDLDGTIRMFSVGAEKMLGYRAKDIVDKKTPALIHLPEEVLARAAQLGAEFNRPIEGFDVFVECARQSGAETREWTYVRKDGSHLPVQLIVTPVLNEDRKITGFLGIAKDISQEKKVAEELHAAMAKAESANRAKSEFVANMSHEIRTPMNAVLGITHLLGNTALSIDQKKYLEMIRTSGKSLLGILNDILDFSKIEAGRMELSPTQFLLDDLLNALAATMSIDAGEKNLELAIGVEPDVPQQLVGDMMRLQQVLINLTSNAIKFTEQGEISVLVEIASQPTDSINDVTLRFSVRDTGIGMNADQQSRLFTAFTQADSSMTRRFGGTGLGLTISKRLIDLMGGSIEIQSELGKGSEFCVTIPLQVASDQGNTKRTRNILGNLRCLVVDNNTTSRDYLSKTIQAWNWQVDNTDSGASAIEHILTVQAKGECYDVILADWKMAGIDGLSIVDTIRKLNPTVTLPIILMANIFGHGKLMVADAESRADAILIKPVTGSSLFDTLHEILGARLGGKNLAPIDLYAQSFNYRLDGYHFLLVEDNLMNQIVARGILEHAGAIVDIADNGEVALAILRNLIQPYDVILMDVQMPVMDGYTATRLIRTELGLTIPVMAMTAGVTESERMECLAAGMNDFIAKPVEAEQMFSTITRYLPARNDDTSLLNLPKSPKDNDASIFNPDLLLASARDNPTYWNTIIGLLKKLVENGISPIADAHLAWIQGRPRDAAQIFHLLRGTIGTLGAKRFADASLEIEKAIHNNEKELVERLFLLLEQELIMTISATSEWLGKQTSFDCTDEDVPALDIAQIGQLRVLLSEKNLEACDLYVKLRPALLHYEKSLKIDAIDQAMDRLDFAGAINCLAMI